MNRRRSIPALSNRAHLAITVWSLLALSAVCVQVPIQAVESDPDTVEAWLGLAQELAGQERTLDALEAARRALQLAPGDPRAGLATARLLARLGAGDEALELLAEVRKQAPLEPEGVVLAALLLKDSGRYEEAASILETAVDAGLSEPRVAEELGLVLLDLDRREQALEVADAALGSHPGDAGLTAITGLALVGDEGRRDEAIGRLRTALDLGFEPAGPIDLEIGMILLDKGEFAAAAEALQRATEQMPNSIEAHYRLGRALRSTGDRDGARAALERFQQLSRARDQAERTAGEIGTMLNEAQSFASANQLDAALEQVETLLESHPDQPRALALKAKILYSQGKAQAALDTIHEAQEMAPGLVEPHYLEGLFQLSLGFPVDAEESLRQTLALAPSMGEASALLAMALAKQERFEEAAERFQEALDHDTDSPALRLGYAAALESLGRLDESLRQQAAYDSLTGN